METQTEEVLVEGVMGVPGQGALSPPQVRRFLSHSAFEQGDLVQVHHGDISDNICQALVEQGEDDDVQCGPLSLETEPEISR